MHSRSNWVLPILAAALIISVAFAALVISDRSELDNDKDLAETRLEMSVGLSEAQMSVQGEIEKIDGLIKNASLRLAAIGLDGADARAVLNDTVSSDPYILDIVTYGPGGVVIAAEPSGFSSLEGQDLTFEDNVRTLLATRMPVMSDVFYVTPDLPGAVIAYPIIDVNGMFIGGVSALFSAIDLMNGTLASFSEESGFTFWCMQLDGMDIFDSDASQIGMNVTGPDYDGFPEVQELGARMLGEASGHGTYSYYADLSLQKVVDKECYWTTVGTMGTEWRLVIVNVLSE